MKRLVLVAAILAGCGSTEATTDDAGGGGGGGAPDAGGRGGSGGMLASGGAGGGALATGGAAGGASCPSVGACGCPSGYEYLCEPGNCCSTRGTVEMTIHVSNQCNGSTAMLRIFDPITKASWPAAPQQPQTFPGEGGGSFPATFSCTDGATLCYGATAAATAGWPSASWGMGIDGDTDCGGACCFTCGAATAPSLIFAPGVRPAPPCVATLK